MSKRNRYKFQVREQNQSNRAASPASSGHKADASASHAAEYRIIRNDMIRLIALNGVMLAAVIVLYYTNRSSGYLERLFEKLF